MMVDGRVKLSFTSFCGIALGTENELEVLRKVVETNVPGEVNDLVFCKSIHFVCRFPELKLQ